MGAAYFYHLTQRPLVETLTMLLGKAQGAGWRVAVRGTDQSLLEQLDVALWRGPEDGFLPHGLAGGPHDAEQPVLLTTDTHAPNNASCVFSIPTVLCWPAPPGLRSCSRQRLIKVGSSRKNPLAGAGSPTPFICITPTATENPSGDSFRFHTA